MTTEKTLTSGAKESASNSDQAAFAARLSTAVAHKGGAAAVAEVMGNSERVVRKWMNGDSDPSRKSLVRLAAALGESIDYLATGRGSSTVSADAGVDSHLVMVPRYSVTVSAGHGREATLPEPIGDLAFRRDWLSKRGLYVDNLALVEVAGDSMEPRLSAGDLVLVDRADTQLRSSRCYVLRVDNDYVVKYVDLQPGGEVLLVAGNPRYKSQTITQDMWGSSIDVFGRVRASSHEWD